MTILAYILGYFALGACASAYRAYREPRMFAEEKVRHRTETLFYREALVLNFLLWPITVPAAALSVAFESVRRRGAADLAQQRVRAKEVAEAEREIDRIIREAKL